MLYAKQVNPEFQEDDLFFSYKNKKTNRYELGMNDDYYVDNVIIDGNRDFAGITTKAYDKIKQLNDLWYEWECVRNKSESYSSFNNATEFIEWYCARDDKLHYSKKDIHVWIKLLDNWTESESDIIEGLYLITRKHWRSFTLRGYCQSEWQEGYASEDLSDASINHIEMCYFNKGMEFIVYESKEDFENDGDCYSIYVEDLNDLRDRLGEEVTVYEFDGYIKTEKYADPVVLQRTILLH